MESYQPSGATRWRAIGAAIRVMAQARPLPRARARSNIRLIARGPSGRSTMISATGGYATWLPGSSMAETVYRRGASASEIPPQGGRRGFNRSVHRYSLSPSVSHGVQAKGCAMNRASRSGGQRFGNLTARWQRLVTDLSSISDLSRPICVCDPVVDLRSSGPALRAPEGPPQARNRAVRVASRGRQPNHERR